MPTLKPKQIVEYLLMEPDAPVVVAPATSSFEQAVSSLERYRDMLEERGHHSVKIEKVVKQRVLRDKWNADILREYPHLRGPKYEGKSPMWGTKHYVYEPVSRQTVAICHLTDKGFKCSKYSEENSI